MDSGREDRNAFEPDFELFARVGTLTKKAADFAGECGRKSDPDPVENPDAIALQKEIASLLERINFQIRDAEEKLRSLDDRWPHVAPGEVSRLAEEFSYLKKWERSLSGARTLLLGG
jgi:hypothetical protein